MIKNLSVSCQKMHISCHNTLLLKKSHVPALEQ